MSSDAGLSEMVDKGATTFPEKWRKITLSKWRLSAASGNCNGGKHNVEKMNVWCIALVQNNSKENGGQLKKNNSPAKYITKSDTRYAIWWTRTE